MMASSSVWSTLDMLLLESSSVELLLQLQLLFVLFLALESLFFLLELDENMLDNTVDCNDGDGFESISE